MLEYACFCCFLLSVLKYLELNLVTVRLPLPIVTFDFVAFTFTLL